MIIVLKPDITQKQIDHIVKEVKKLGLKPHVSKGIERTIIGVVGEEEVLSTKPLEVFPGVEKVMPILKPYKLVSREYQPEASIIDFGRGIKLGGKRIHVMAGPCAVETQELLLSIAHKVKKSGATFLRGGAFKPRTSPYSFQGLGEEGLKYLREAADHEGLLVVTEVMDTRDVHLVERYTDCLQIGARNMQNFNLLKEVGLCKKPVMLKRGLSSTVKEWLMSAEYIVSTGNPNVFLCERGIRTFEDSTRNTLDLSAVPVVKSLSHLPIIVDPSHGTGQRHLIAPMACAGVAAGADGIMVEVHPNPEKAKSDGAQALLPDMFDDLMQAMKGVARAIGREI
ncbi:MAG: 3-deoxy-7-phosphoheptulonate synthase [Candidatus Omnitrophica bacterium]|nr:3-deoxy-7-phosphoheptulonate synthase [Candidatus Omnitrophota bacterium]